MTWILLTVCQPVEAVEGGTQSLAYKQQCLSIPPQFWETWKLGYIALLLLDSIPPACQASQTRTKAVSFLFRTERTTGSNNYRVLSSVSFLYDFLCAYLCDSILFTYFTDETLVPLQQNLVTPFGIEPLNLCLRGRSGGDEIAGRLELCAIQTNRVIHNIMKRREVFLY